MILLLTRPRPVTGRKFDATRWPDGWHSNGDYAMVGLDILPIGYRSCWYAGHHHVISLGFAYVAWGY